MLGAKRSAAYLMAPVTLAGASSRRVECPMKVEAGACSCSASAPQLPFITSRASSTASTIFW